MNKFISYFIYRSLVKFSKLFINKHTFKIIQRRFYANMGITIHGMPEYIDLTARFDTSGQIELHQGVVISNGVVVLTHDYSIVNAQIAQSRHSIGLPYVGDVTIGKNSFVGINALIMPGVRIGADSIIAAGAVVVSNVADGVVVAGNPAREIGKTIELTYKAEYTLTNKSIRLPRVGARFVSIC